MMLFQICLTYFLSLNIKRGVKKEYHSCFFQNNEREIENGLSTSQSIIRVVHHIAYIVVHFRPFALTNNFNFGLFLTLIYHVTRQDLEYDARLE